MKKKLLIFGPANSPHLLNWALPFVKEFNVEILTFHSPAKDQDYRGIKINYIPSITHTKFDYILQHSKVQKIIGAINPDILHAHYASSYGLLAASMRGNFLKVLTVWGSDINQSRKNFIHRFFIDQSLVKFDWVNVPSNNLKLVLLEAGVKNEKILLFQYGTDLEFCLKQKKTKISRQEIKIFSSRFWNSLYNIDKVITGFKIANQSNSNIRLFLSGSGTEEEKGYITSLVDNHPAIHMLGFLSKEQLINELWDSDIFISIPNTDGMSLSVLEALFCECFPILSDIPPNQEILEKGEGIILKELTSEGVAHGLLEAVEKISNANLSRNIEFVDEMANYHKNMKYMANIYNERKVV